jgi:hypothetical protein
MADLPVIQPPLQLSAPLLGHLAGRLRTAMESELDRFGLRARHLLALTVLRELGQTSQANLSEALRLDRTNLVGLLNELEDAGLIERRRSTGGDGSTFPRPAATVGIWIPTTSGRLTPRSSDG